MLLVTMLSGRVGEVFQRKTSSWLMLLWWKWLVGPWFFNKKTRLFEVLERSIW